VFGDWKMASAAPNGDDVQEKVPKVVEVVEVVEDSSKFDRNVKIAFLGGLTFLGIMSGFGSAVAMAKKRDPSSFDKGLLAGAERLEGGGSLALRALALGSLCAVGGVGLLCFSVYKLLDVQNSADFRRKMTAIMPQVPKKAGNPNERTDFESIRDFFQYIGEEKRK
jgi:Protein of unknown function (DUF1358)